MSDTISSSANERVKYVRRLQTDRRFRARESAFVVEGTRWLVEAMESERDPLHVFFTDAWAADDDHAALLADMNRLAHRVTSEVMAAMSDVQTPPGVLAVLPVVPMPLPAHPTLLLILDRVRTPGNLGTMLRTAAAAGADGVLLAPGCVDPYNPKVIRGGMGAQLRLPVHTMSWSQIREHTTTMSVWVAAANGQFPYNDVNWRQPSALVIGSEAHGSGVKAGELARGSIYIPMFRATESLNAAMAAGIILFEAARQRR